MSFLKWKNILNKYLYLPPNMVDVAQLVRASVCGTEGRGFESRQPPHLQARKVLRIGSPDLRLKLQSGFEPAAGWPIPQLRKSQSILFLLQEPYRWPLCLMPSNSSSGTSYSARKRDSCFLSVCCTSGLACP